MNLRDYQAAAVEDAIAFLRNGGKRRCYVSPTGTGKSFMLAKILEAFPNAFLVTPRIEIVSGLLQKLGVKVPTSTAKIAQIAFEHRISTPIRARNAFNSGAITRWPSILIIDECHHSEALSYQELSTLVGSQMIGFTATPYRGTPQSTKSFLEFWGEPTTVITFKEASDRGHLAAPAFKLLPLVDDDLIEIRGGEFTVTSANKTVLSRLDDMAGHLQPHFSGGLWDRATVLTVPSRQMAAAAQNALTAISLPSVLVIGTTNRKARDKAFDDVVNRRSLLVQIDVVSEGVDLPLRRLVDMSPTLSLRKWVQRVGRITRPTATGEPPPECWITNRNLERHAYVFEGFVPNTTLAAAQSAFGGPSIRSGIRVIGLEGLGRFKPVPIPLVGGLRGSMYSMRTVEGLACREYAILLHPAKVDPIIATRLIVKVSEGNREFGKWEQIDSLPDMTGVSSAVNGVLTPKQTDWWRRAASRHGLDPEATPTVKQFAVLPILSHLKVEL